MLEAGYGYSQWATEQPLPIHATSQGPVARQSVYAPQPDDSASLRASHRQAAGSDQLPAAGFLQRRVLANSAPHKFPLEECYKGGILQNCFQIAVCSP